MSSLIVAVRSAEGLTLVADHRLITPEGLIDHPYPAWVTLPTFAVAITGIIDLPRSPFDPGAVVGTFFREHAHVLNSETLAGCAQALEDHARKIQPRLPAGLDASFAFTDFLICSAMAPPAHRIATIRAYLDGRASRVTFHPDAACIGLLAHVAHMEHTAAKLAGADAGTIIGALSLEFTRLAPLVGGPLTAVILRGDPQSGNNPTPMYSLEPALN